MNFGGNHTRREILVTLSIWTALMVIAIGGLLLLRSKAHDIIDHIHYVNVSRGAKAQVLYAEAEKNAREVLEKAEGMNRLSGRKYNVARNDKNLQRSVALFNEALEVDNRGEFSPERTMYYELLGQVHDAAGNRPEQLIAHTRALLSQNATDDAMDFIELLREADPESPEPLLLLAQLHDLNGETSSAMAALDELYTTYTVTPKARWVKAGILARSGIVDEAIQELKKSVEEDPDNLTYRRDLGNLLARAARKEEAVKVLEAGLDHGAWMDAAYLHNYGDYLTDTGDLDEAIKVLKQADQLAPYSGDVQWSLAKAYHLAKKPKMAASMLRRATEIRPELHDQVF